MTEPDRDTGDSSEKCPYCATPLASTQGPDGSLTQSCENPDCMGKQGPEHAAVD